IRVMTYINPYLVDVGNELPGRRNLYQEAKAKGYLVTTDEGAVRYIHSGTIKAGVIDLFNREAADWYAGIISENLIGTGASGFMADFGESFPMEWGVRLHNQYPVLWAKTVRKAIDAAPNGDQIVAFHRSGFTDSPRHATAFWAGDQLVTWGKHDGLKSAITAMMTGGISGMAYNHSDIGGYTTVVTPFTDIRRDKELFQRWAEFAAFTPIFRTHEGNQPRENHQFDTDAETLTHFAKMTRLFQCLHPYRKRLMAEHSQTGAPLMRHPWLHYPDDKRFHPMTYQQMMLGADMMVVPVSDPGLSTVSAYLPDDGWELFWSGKVYQAGDHQVAAPIGQPAFFVRAGSAVKRELEACRL
ncbi:MAG: TIM-barrel domain-containing protein, partial [Alphaproteobacteria bacterium]